MSALVAVTGATGFIGQHLTATLAAAGLRQRLLVRRLPSLPLVDDSSAIELVMGDLADAAALKRLVRGADAVIHLAGAIKALNRNTFFRSNARAVHDLLAALHDSDTAARLVLVSSLAAREPHLSDYAASKRAGEEALKASTYAGWVVVRVPAVYGPGDRETLAFFRAVKRGLAPLPAGRAGRLSLIHVTDLCRALVALVAQPPPSDIYEIDDGAVGGHSLTEMAGVAARILGSRPLVVAVPRLVMSAVACGQQIAARLTGRPAILSPGKVREIFHEDWVVTDRRLAAVLRLAPGFDLERGFADTIDWYRQHKWL